MTRSGKSIYWTEEKKELRKDGKSDIVELPQTTSRKSRFLHDRHNTRDGVQAIIDEVRIEISTFRIKEIMFRFVGVSGDDKMQDNALVYRTIRKAKKEVADGLILHSDQGFQYTSNGYSTLTKEYGILPSMSRAGTPLDNAPAENFFGTFKAECFYRQKVETIDETRRLVQDYVNFYNYERIQLKTMLTPFKKRRRLA